MSLRMSGGPPDLGRQHHVAEDAAAAVERLGAAHGGVAGGVGAEEQPQPVRGMLPVEALVVLPELDVDLGHARLTTFGDTLIMLGRCSGRPRSCRDKHCSPAGPVPARAVLASPRRSRCRIERWPQNWPSGRMSVTSSSDTSSMSWQWSKAT